MPLVQLLQRRDISKELEALWNATKDLPRGSLVEHETIEAASMIERDNTVWGRLIKNWKRQMARDRGIWMTAVNGVGYRLLMVEEQLKDRPEKIEKSAMRRMRASVECAGVIPETELDETQRRYQMHRVSHSTAIAELQKKQKAERQSWLANPETLPRLTNGNGKHK